MRLWGMKNSKCTYRHLDNIYRSNGNIVGGVCTFALWKRLSTE